MLDPDYDTESVRHPAEPHLGTHRESRPLVMRRARSARHAEAVVKHLDQHVSGVGWRALVRTTAPKADGPRGKSHERRSAARYDDVDMAAKLRSPTQTISLIRST